MTKTLLPRAAATMLAAALIAATQFPSLSQTQATPAATPAATPPPVSQATPSTTYGDLQHLTYTATGPLTASFFEPENGESSPISAIAAAVTTVAGAGVEILVNGEIVPTRQLGKRTVDTKTGETRYYYYGIPLDPGPNVLTAVPIGADDVHGPASTITVYGPGDPAMIRTAFEQHLIADGTSVAPLDISVVDQWGHPAMPGQRLRVTILSGDARFVNLPAPAVVPSAEPGQTPATPAPSDNASSDPGVGRVYEGPTSPGGFTRISLVGGMVAGNLELEISVGNVKVRKSFYIDPFVRTAFVNGLISVGAGSMPGSIDGDAIDDNGGARRLRGAVYATGKVGKDTLLTAVYESQNRLTQESSLGPYTQDPGERPYQTYGDTSQLTSEDHSNDHLYARLDHGQDNLLWGQYTATLGDSSGVGAYTQFLSGLKGEINLGHSQTTHAMAFTARNDLAYVQQIISPNGLSTQQLQQPLQPNIVVDSDNILLTVLDRRTGAILSQTPLIRNVDYTIDYATGILRFINIPLPFDSLGDPQTLVVQYQYQGPGVKSETTGGTLKLGIGGPDSKEALAFGYVNDASGGQNFSLFSQSLSKTWSNGQWSISHADSAGTIPLPGVASTTLGSTGQALAAHLDEHDGFDAITLDADRTSAGYNDPFGGLSTPGLGNYQAQFSRTIPKKSTLTASIDAQTDDYQGQNNSERDASVSYQWFLKKLTFLTGLVEHEQTVGITATATPVPGTSATPVPLLGGSQLLAHAAVTFQASKRLTFGIDQFLTLSGSQIGSTQPTQTLAQLSYQFPQKGSLFVRELWSATPQATFANSVSALTTGVASTHTTEIGIERPLSPTTTVTSEYNVDQTGSETDIYSSLGVDQSFKFNSKFGGNLFAQGAAAQGNSQSGFSVFGLTVGYANDQKMRTTFSYQDRSGGGGGSTASLGLAGHLSPEISLVGTVERAYGNGLAAINDQVSLAYRPVYSDRWTSLLNYTRSNGSDTTDGIGSVVTFEELFRPWTGFELAGKFAYKLDGDSEYLAHTSLVGLRAKQAIGSRFDVAAEVRQVSVPSIATSRETDFATELGYQLGNSARIAVGYNFSGGADPSLMGHPVRKGFYVTLTTLVDRIFGWGKQ